MKKLIIFFLSFIINAYSRDESNNFSKEYQMKINYSKEIETDNLKEKTNINFEIEFSSKN
ncbi:MAG: hypothetical protein KHZ27_01225 [Fusobacterium sp.]|nr:hypothetical protein [Fusobacterium sp.]